MTSDKDILFLKDSGGGVFTPMHRVLTAKNVSPLMRSLQVADWTFPSAARRQIPQSEALLCIQYLPCSFIFRACFSFDNTSQRELWQVYKWTYSCFAVQQHVYCLKCSNLAASSSFSSCIHTFIMCSNKLHSHLFMAALGLRCCTHAFSLVAASGGYSSLRCAGFSCCGARALGAWASVVVARGLSTCGSWALERRLSSCDTRA